MLEKTAHKISYWCCPPLCWIGSCRPKSHPLQARCEQSGDRPRRSPVEWLGDFPSFFVRNNRYIASYSHSAPSLHNDGRSPLTTLIDADSLETPSIVTRRGLEHLIKSYLEHDDVFCFDFLANVVFFGKSPAGICVDDDVGSLFEAWGTRSHQHVAVSEFDVRPLSGPYLARGDSLWQALRLYNDNNNTFLAPCLLEQDSTTTYRTVFLEGEEYQMLSVAVPPRQFNRRSAKIPLAGMRIAVKDIIDLEGLRTSAGSRAYFEVYLPCKTTAPSIRSLTDAGAIIIGKTKLSSFAAREEPAEGLDFQAPFNPRGDGFQSPAGSSSGSAAAVASYDWLDFAIGSDTTGSGRRPAHWNGCFCLRPSSGALPLEGLVKTFEYFDTPCLFGRDINKFGAFISAWYDTERVVESVKRPEYELCAPKTEIHKKPARIVIPLDYLPGLNSAQASLIEGFTNDLESYLGVKSTRLSLTDEWRSSAPEDSLNFQHYMENAPTHAFFYELYHNFDEFRTRYHAAFNRAPYVSSMLRWRWEIAESLTREQRDEAMRRLHVFKQWFLKDVMCTDRYRTYVILPIEEMRPMYRDVQPPPPKLPRGIDMLDISPALGAPELVVPIGEIPYESRASKRIEFLPVGISMMGAPGTDANLIEVARACLEKAKRPTVVMTGRSIFGTKSKEQPS